MRNRAPLDSPGLTLPTPAPICSPAPTGKARNWSRRCWRDAGERPVSCQPPGQEARVPKLLRTSPGDTCAEGGNLRTVYTNLSSSANILRMKRTQPRSPRNSCKKGGGRASPVVHRRRPDGIFQTTSMVAWECLLQSTTICVEAKSVSDLCSSSRALLEPGLIAGTCLGFLRSAVGLGS